MYDSLAIRTIIDIGMLRYVAYLFYFNTPGWL